MARRKRDALIMHSHSTLPATQATSTTNSSTEFSKSESEILPQIDRHPICGFLVPASCDANVDFSRNCSVANVFEFSPQAQTHPYELPRNAYPFEQWFSVMMLLASTLSLNLSQSSREIVSSIGYLFASNSREHRHSGGVAHTG